MSNITDAYLNYMESIIALSSIADNVYDNINIGGILKLEKASGEKTYVYVASKSKSLDNGDTYDVNVTGRTLEVKSTTGYLPSGATITYTNPKETKDILTGNTPQASDDPLTGSMMNINEFVSDTSWKSNFYLS